MRFSRRGIYILLYARVARPLQLGTQPPDQPKPCAFSRRQPTYFRVHKKRTTANYCCIIGTTSTPARSKPSALQHSPIHNSVVQNRFYVLPTSRHIHPTRTRDKNNNKKLTKEWATPLLVALSRFAQLRRRVATALGRRSGRTGPASS